MRLIIRVAMAIMVTLLLGACGTSTPVRYFSLNPIDTISPPGGEDRRVVGFGPLDLPGYLARPQIVTRGANSEIIIDDFRRWAEPVDESIHRIVAANVEALVDGVTVVSYPYHTMAHPEFRVYGDVVRFDADESGMAVLVVQWGVVSADRITAVPPTRSRYVSQASSAADTGAVVSALNEVIADFSRDVATHLNDVLKRQAIRD